MTRRGVFKRIGEVYPSSGFEVLEPGIQRLRLGSRRDLSSFREAATGGLLLHAGEAYPMPTGTMTAAVMKRGFDHPSCFAIVDGDLHVIELSYD